MRIRMEIMFLYYLEAKSSQNVSFLNYISVVFALEIASEKCYNPYL